MHELKPMIRTFEAALEYIKHYDRPKLFYFNSAFENIVLTGGSIRHHITVSLISSYKTYKDFGTWHCQEHKRLVINDAGYRTKYWLEKDEYNELLSKIRKFAEERGLKLKVIYQFYTEEAILERIRQLDFSNFEIIKNREVREE